MGWFYKVESMEKTDINIERVRAALAEKETAAQRHRDAAALVEHEAQDLRTALRVLEDLDKIARGVTNNTAAKTTKAGHAAGFAREYIRVHGPSSIGVLYDAYITAGHELAGLDDADKKMTLSGFLNRDGRVRYYKEHGRWWHPDQPYPTSAIPSMAKRLFPNN